VRRTSGGGDVCGGSVNCLASIVCYRVFQRATATEGATRAISDETGNKLLGDPDCGEKSKR